MKSSHCKTRWHDKCAFEIEHDDGSAHICECECHRLTQEVMAGGEMPLTNQGVANKIQLDAPPPHPETFDHNVFRVAEEQPGVDSYQPWVKDFCIECHLPTWTHDHARAEKHEILCENCSYMLISELSETRAKRQNTPVIKWHDPFAR